MSTRRQFLRDAGGLVIGAACSGSTWSAPGLLGAEAPKSPVRIGLIADVHQDIMHDGVERLTAFIREMTVRQVDWIVNLGDFCVPHPRNDPFLAAWNAFSGPRWHVLGNHDMDEGFDREQVVEHYGMPGRYYSRDVAGIHLIVLDANDPDGHTKKYPMFVADDQLAWLRDDLERSRLPTVVCVHQPIDAHDAWVTNAAAVRRILRESTRPDGHPKVVAVFSGHAHLDYVRTSDGIPHFQINSASYAWTGIDHDNYPQEITANHPRLRKACPYAEPLWAVATLDPHQGEIRIEGRSSAWVGPDPWQLGLEEDDYQRSRALSRPAISHLTSPSQ